VRRRKVRVKVSRYYKLFMVCRKNESDLDAEEENR
jgi:hypothetical protein